jgi:bla regulator protein blaR1
MMSLVALAIVKATLVCGVAFFLSHLCRRTRASIRHLLFALAFTALVAIPAAGTVLPTLAVKIPAPATAPATGIRDMGSAALSSAGAAASGSSTPSVSRDTAPTRSVTVAQAVIATWLTGVALFLIPVVIGFWQMRRLRQAASEWIDGQALVRALAPTLAVHRPIDVLLHEGVAGPMTCGMLRPAIILPATAKQWDEATLRCALGHELEHIARWDFLTHCLSRMVCAAYWFHPLVWATWRRLRLEAERACDDAVLRENDARDYASLLVSIAQWEAADTRPSLLAMAGRDDLAARVAAVLDECQTRGRIGRRRATALIITGAIATFGIASITVAHEMPQPQTRSPTASPPTFETASLKRNPSSRISHVDGRMIATNMSLRRLLIFAFGVRDIDNAPWWVEDRFDIVATAPAEFVPEQGSKMLQSLLTERFKLVAHRGSKEFPIYALVLARPDGRLGSQMIRSQIDCSRERLICGMSSTGGRLAGGGVTMAQLAKLLPTHLHHHSRRAFDRELIDRTGLTGRFDFTLEWTPDEIAPRTAARSGPPQFRPFTSALESNAPRLLAALQEQLGLQIDSQLTPEPVLVIDKIERPTEN